MSERIYNVKACYEKTASSFCRCIAGSHISLHSLSIYINYVYITLSIYKLQIACFFIQFFKADSDSRIRIQTKVSNRIRVRIFKYHEIAKTGVRSLAGSGFFYPNRNSDLYSPYKAPNLSSPDMNPDP